MKKQIIAMNSGDIEKGSEVSVSEKTIISQITPEMPLLDYPIKMLKMANGTTEMVYVIPKKDKAKLLEELYPFSPAPAIDEKRFDIHEQKVFDVKDFIVVRTRNRNMLASPYFPHSGGMMIDWFLLDSDSIDIKDSEGALVVTNRIK